ncbi:MAG: hypothetical protein ACOX2S_04105 [bacterium]
MRVLLVVRPCQGGMVTHVRTLARKLKEASHEVYIAGPESLSSAGMRFSSCLSLITPVPSSRVHRT